jgi:hypothetical protein
MLRKYFPLSHILGPDWRHLQEPNGTVLLRDGICTGEEDTERVE